MRRDLYDVYYPSKREWDRIMDLISDGENMAIIRPAGKLGTFAITMTGNAEKIVQALNEYATPKLVATEYEDGICNV